MDKYAPVGLADWLAGFFNLAPAGFLLGLAIGLIGFGVFALFNLLVDMIRR